MDISNPSKWMSTVNGNLTLKDICMPASHDSGMYALDIDGKMIISPFIAFPLETRLGLTQSKSIKEQLRLGVRYFDFRVERLWELTAFGHVLRFYHGESWFKKVNSVKLDQALEDIKKFLQNEGQDETVVIMYSHFYMNKDKGTELFFDDYINKKEYGKNYQLSRDVVNGRKLNTIPLKELRGKIVSIIDDGEKEFSYKKIKNNNVYRRSEFFSLYDNYANKTTFEKMRDDQIAKFSELESPEELFCLNWTLTNNGSMTWDNKSEADRINPKIIQPDEFTNKNLLQPNSHGNIVNILSVDYVDSWALEVCEKIFYSKK